MIITTFIAVKVSEIDTCIHLSGLNVDPPELYKEHDHSKRKIYSCEPLEDLIFLFKKQDFGAATDK